MSKWRGRADAIAATGAPPSVACHLYNTHALTTLSYIGQLYFPPRELCAQEPSVLARMMRCPYNAFTRSDFFNLYEWGSVLTVRLLGG